MPVTLARNAPADSVASLRERRMRRGSLSDRGRLLRVELVNNMPDAAVFSTQRQFIRLLEEAAAAYKVTLGFTSLDGVERSAEARREMGELYRAPAQVGEAPPDAVIVTGAEPRAEELDAEPYWRELTAFFDMARARTHATLASCLAAHALVLHRDGLRRRRCGQKLSGLYSIEIVAPHPLTQGLSGGPTPHSRWNGLDEAELTAKGYVVLTRAHEAGVDMFARDDEPHLVLGFQGHPEYDGDTLAREFRRDVARALAGAPAPRTPVNYYPPEVAERLSAHVAGMLAGQEGPHLPDWAKLAPQPDWRTRGAVVVANWLQAISARKTAAQGPTLLRARWGG
jgi:homoserine O-succinyltransferase